jgi:hypothetical protein
MRFCEAEIPVNRGKGRRRGMPPRSGLVQQLTICHFWMNIRYFAQFSSYIQYSSSLFPKPLIFFMVIKMLL